MQKKVTGIIIDGYESGETDFLTRLSQCPQEVQDEFNATIIEPLLAVLASSEQAAVLVVEGHSDRVDTPGLSREECRRQAYDFVVRIRAIMAWMMWDGKACQLTSSSQRDSDSRHTSDPRPEWFPQIREKPSVASDELLVQFPPLLCVESVTSRRRGA